MISKLIAQLRSLECESKKDAVRKLGKIGTAAAEALPSLIENLQEVDYELKASLVEAIEQIISPVSEKLWQTAPALTKLLNHSRREVRGKAATVLRKLSLQRCIDDESCLFRESERIKKLLLEIVVGPRAHLYRTDSAIVEFIDYHVCQKPPADHISVGHALKGKRDLFRRRARGLKKQAKKPCGKKIKESKIEDIEKGKIVEPAIVTPRKDEILLVEEDVTETSLDIDDLEIDGTPVPTIDFSSVEPKEDGAAQTISGELTFEEDSGSYILEPSDDVLIDTPQDLIAVDAPDEETFVDDIGLQTEPLEMDISDRDQDVKAAEEEKQKRLRPKEREIPTFEKFLGDDAGRPGPLERLAAQSATLLKLLQATIGLRFIMLANALDIAIESVTGYVQGIFQAWKTSRTIRKRMQRRDASAQIEGLIDDLALCRLNLSRIFSFTGFFLEEHSIELPESPDWDKNLGPGFALKLVVDTRSHLDQMKRDLSLITASQVARFIKNSISDFLLSFIPNPLDLLAPWKDLFIMAVMMKYSRRQIEEMYVDIVVQYRRIIELLQKPGAEITPKYHRPAAYEKAMIEEMACDDLQPNLESAIDHCRNKVQRLIQMLCNPGQFIDPRKWSRCDLLLEFKKMEKMDKANPIFALELNRWLLTAVKRAFSRKRMRVNTREKQLRYLEAKEFRRRYRLHRKLSAQFQ